MLILLIFGLLLPASQVDPPPFVVVVNRSNKMDTLSRSKLSLIYTRKVSRWPWGAETRPVDLAADSPLRKAFVRVVLRTSSDQLKLYWIDQKVNSNTDPPLEISDPEEVRSYVAANVGAVGYLPPESVDTSVKVLKVE